MIPYVCNPSSLEAQAESQGLNASLSFLVRLSLKTTNGNRTTKHPVSYLLLWPDTIKFREDLILANGLMGYGPSWQEAWQEAWQKESPLWCMLQGACSRCIGSRSRDGNSVFSWFIPFLPFHSFCDLSLSDGSTHMQNNLPSLFVLLWNPNTHAKNVPR